MCNVLAQHFSRVLIMYTRIYTCVSTCLCVCVCVCARARVCVCDSHSHSLSLSLSLSLAHTDYHTDYSRGGTSSILFRFSCVCSQLRYSTLLTCCLCWLEDEAAVQRPFIEDWLSRRSALQGKDEAEEERGNRKGKGEESEGDDCTAEKREQGYCTK